MGSCLEQSNMQIRISEGCNIRKLCLKSEDKDNFIAFIVHLRLECRNVVKRVEEVKSVSRRKKRCI